MIGAILGLAGGMAGNVMQQKNQDKRFNQEQDLMDKQIENQKELNKYNQQLGLETWHNTNYSAQRQELEKAGLNTGLLYGQGGGGGTTMGNAVGSASGGTSPSYGNELQTMTQMGLQLGLLQAQKENIEADTLNKKADAENKGAKTITENETREFLKENMRQTGISQWLENEIQQYKTSNPEDIEENSIVRNAIYNKSNTIGGNSFAIKQLNADLLQTLAQKDKTISEMNLTDKKAQGYWQELLNATAHADADKTKAAATKLAAEWGTGEYTNWKTWTELGKDAINLLTNILK